jgi:arginase
MHRKTMEIIVSPYDVERRDTPMARGPHGLLEHGFPARLRETGWEIHVTEVQVPEELPKLEAVTGIGRQIARAVELAVPRGRFPLILSGGCLAGLGVVAGLQRLGPPGGDNVAVVWIDAHGDFNTPETSASGYWDGMALAAVCGVSLPELREGIGARPLGVERAVHLAGRAFDPLEIGNAERLGLPTIPPDRVATPDSRERLRSRTEGRALYLHVDMDGLDPRDAPAVGFPEPDGARLAELLCCREALPAPAAMTLSALSFDRAGAGEAGRTVDACARLVEAFAAGSSGAIPKENGRG